MKPSVKAIGIALAVLVVIIIGWHYLHKAPAFKPKTGDTGDTVTQQVNSFDEFQDSLAQRVLAKLGADNLSVVVAIADYPIGMLLGAKGSLPADVSDCQPSSLPKPFAAGRLFPSYTLSSSTALTANVGSHAIDGLDSAGVSLKQGSNVQYSIDNVQIQVLDDKSLAQLTSGGNCGKFIQDNPGTRLIRGLVTGRVTFTVELSDPASAQAKLSKIADLSISDDPGSSTVRVSDPASQPIVLLLSEFAPPALTPATATAPPPPAPKPIQRPAVAATSPAPAPAPAPAPVQVHIYVQQDVNSPAEEGREAVQQLRQDWPNAVVEQKVELIPSKKMPGTPQVRYFNDADSGLAAKCLSMLQSKYPKMRVVRVGLTSPQGQLEVWLPKAGT